MRRSVLMLVVAAAVAATGGCTVEGPKDGASEPTQPGTGVVGPVDAGARASSDAAPAAPGTDRRDAAGGGTPVPNDDAAKGGGNSDADAATGGGGAPPTSPGFLHTQGKRILDHEGHVVRLTGINWFGLETSNYAPHGLWSRSMGELLDAIDTLGYNVIRLPFCNQLFDSKSIPNGIDYGKNPDLVGLSGLQLMDKLVDGARARGIRVLLDRHRPDSSAQSALWYTSSYSEQRWIDDWKMLAARYAGNPTVIGADLHNEPHGNATWGTGDAATDWQLAAQKAGNAILQANPDWLVVVEGVEQAEQSAYWWGGNLKGAQKHPVKLSLAGRLVYSTHDYPSTVFHQTWFDDPSYPDNLPALWRDRWAFLVENDTAPVLVGEFGTRYETDSDRKWLGKLASFAATNELSFTFWCLNPNSGDTGGILMDDWVTVNRPKQAAIAPLLAPKLP